MEKAPNMANVDWYLDNARDKSRIPSDGKLSLEMGLARITVNHWRQRKAWPSPDNMVKLARLGNVDERHALIDLMTWRNDTGVAAGVWQSIKSALKSVPLLLLLFLQKPAEAADFSHFSIGQSGSAAVSNLYIMS